MRTLMTNWRVSLAGLLSWLIPFVASFPFFDPAQGLLIPLPLFKSLMVVIGSGVGLTLLVWIFFRLPMVRGGGLAIGVYWLLINWALDILVLVPMSGSDIGTWFIDTGLRYLTIPMMAVALCLVAQRKRPAAADS